MALRHPIHHVVGFNIIKAIGALGGEEEGIGVCGTEEGELCLGRCKCQPADKSEQGLRMGGEGEGLDTNVLVHGGVVFEDIGEDLFE